jgi:uncharacterized small protein (DUF1192 family)
VVSAIALPTGVALFAIAMLWRVTSDGHDDVAHRAMAVPAAFLGIALACFSVMSLAQLVASLEGRIAQLEAERALQNAARALDAVR